jgi:hypothetical protein
LFYLLGLTWVLFSRRKASFLTRTATASADVSRITVLSFHCVMARPVIYVMHGRNEPLVDRSSSKIREWSPALTTRRSPVNLRRTPVKTVARPDKFVRTRRLKACALLLALTLGFVVASKSSEKVLRWEGSTVRHYVLNDEQEYFAETTEDFVGVNDYYPFLRPELPRQDRAVFDLLHASWGVTPATTQ